MLKTSSVFNELDDKAERDAYVRSLIGVTIPMQIRALREKRNWNQDRLAEQAGMLQPRISSLESPGGNVPNLNTLLRIASAFDVGLLVWFVPFSELIQREENFMPDNFAVPSFSAQPAIELQNLREYKTIPSTPVFETFAAKGVEPPQKSTPISSAIGDLHPELFVRTAATQLFPELHP